MTLSTSRHSAVRALALVATLFLMGCDDDDGGTGPDVVRGDPGVHIVTGAGVTDTIGSEPGQALVVEVFDEDGRAATGSVVRFETVEGDAWVFVGRLDDDDPWTFAVDTVDERGRAAVLVRLGERVGTGQLSIVVPELGFSDTATFTITPGQPASMTASPLDTAAYVGNGYTVTAQVMDRAENPLDHEAELEVLTGPVGVSGDVVTGSALGRASIEVRAAGFVDTARVSIVPEGTLAAFASPPHTGYAVELYTFDLDGSDLRRVVTTKIGAGYFGDMPATWSPDGTRLVYHDNNNDHTKTLYEVNLATLATSRFIDEPGVLEDERWPLFSADGEWVLFNGGTFWEQTAYRVRADGTDPSAIGPAGALHPSLSPDGTRVAYQMGEGLAVMNLATGVETPLGVTGWLPVWAPDGSEIFYTANEGGYDIAGRVRAVQPNGTGDRAVSSSAVRWRVSVSPDGDWIVGANAQTGQLLLVATHGGTELPLPLMLRSQDWWGDTRAFSAPVWKP